MHKYCIGEKMSNITHKLNYIGNFTKGDVIEIYCKKMANLGPLNIFAEKLLIGIVI
jgi:hypothetical protein